MFPYIDIVYNSIIEIREKGGAKIVYVYLRSNICFSAYTLYEHVFICCAESTHKCSTTRTHLNMCLVYRTYVRWKYTFTFSYKNERSIYLYIINISLSRPFSTFLFLYYIISIYKNENTLSRTLPFLPLSYPYPYILFYYILYI